MQVTSQHHDPAAVPSGKNPETTEQEPRRTPQPVWTFRKRISLSSTGIQTPTRPSRSLVCVPTTLSRFPHKTHNMIHYIIYIYIYIYIYLIYLKHLIFNFTSPNIPPLGQRPWCPNRVTPQGLYVNSTHDIRTKFRENGYVHSDFTTGTDTPLWAMYHTRTFSQTENQVKDTCQTIKKHA